MSKFVLGRTVMTYLVTPPSGNLDFLGFVNESMVWYQACDWGEMDDEDKAMNGSVVKNGYDFILAAYRKYEPLTKNRMVE